MTIDAPGMPTEASKAAEACPWKVGDEFDFELGVFSRVLVVNYVTLNEDPNLIHRDAAEVKRYCGERGITVRRKDEWIVPGMQPVDKLNGHFVRKFGQDTSLFEIKRLTPVGLLYTGEAAKAEITIMKVEGKEEDVDWQITCKVRIVTSFEGEVLTTALGTGVCRVPKKQPGAGVAPGTVNAADLVPPVKGENPAHANH